MIKKFSGLILYLLITVFVVTLYLDQPEILNSWEMTVYDKLFQLRGKQDVSDDVLIISIDDFSTRGEYSWPWNRGQMAVLVEKIAKQNPKSIFFNLPLSNDPNQDATGLTDSLGRVFRDAGNVILPYRFSSSDMSDAGYTLPEYIEKNKYSSFDNVSRLEKMAIPAATTIYPPTPKLAESAAAFGFMGMSFDSDKYIRSAPMILHYAGEYLPSVTEVIAQTYFGHSPSETKIYAGESIISGKRTIPIDEQGRMRINFNGPSRTFKYIPAIDIINDVIGKRDLTGKVAIVSYTGTSSVDLYFTPTSKTMFDSEIIANGVENIIHDNFLDDYGSAKLINLLVIIGMGIFSAVILPRISLMFRMIVLGIFLLVVANVSFVLFTNFDIMTKVFYPMIMTVFFIATAPMMKLHKERASEEDDEEIDYEALLAGTPLSGIQTNMHMNAIGGNTSQTVMAQRQATGKQAAVATMPISTQTTSAKAAVPVGNFGRYKVLEPIGQGAMGMVYKGLDPAIDRPVALKTIRLDNIVNSNEMFELKERLTREAKAAGQLSHPNIVTVYDVGEEQSIQYIAMEFLEGKTLESVIDEKRQWDYKTLCKLIIQVCEALDFAHERGIVHRDIKPANIMMLNDDRVKVMDFGIARLDQSNITQSGVALGTPNYISPEQLKSQTIDRRSDIFSLGVVFYELLTFMKPFKGDTISALIYSILHTNPAAPSEINMDVPRIFDKISAKSLAKDPDLRFQSAREMADILRKLI